MKKFLKRMLVLKISQKFWWLESLASFKMFLMEILESYIVILYFVGFG